eukprot:m.130741 g.130741  ORF g.130741 m.130741 type:complete len:435 (-) comp14607_c0_seq1:289-1593(-)
MEQQEQKEHQQLQGEKAAQKEQHAVAPGASPSTSTFTSSATSPAVCITRSQFPKTCLKLCSCGHHIAACGACGKGYGQVQLDKQTLQDEVEVLAAYAEVAKNQNQSSKQVTSPATVTVVVNNINTTQTTVGLKQNEPNPEKQTCIADLKHFLLTEDEGKYKWEFYNTYPKRNKYPRNRGLRQFCSENSDFEFSNNDISVTQKPPKKQLPHEAAVVGHEDEIASPVTRDIQDNTIRLEQTTRNNEERQLQWQHVKDNDGEGRCQSEPPKFPKEENQQASEPTDFVRVLLQEQQEQEQQQRQELNQQRHRQPHVLQFVSGPQCTMRGTTVGMAVDDDGDEYTWEGDVIDGKPNGFGKQTFLSGDLNGNVYYGDLKDGEAWGYCVAVFPNGNKKFYRFEQGYNRGEQAYDHNNAVHRTTLHQNQLASQGRAYMYPDF